MIASLFLAASLLTTTEPLTLILNSENRPGELPRNFRMMQELKASGSGQFSESGLRSILERIPPPHSLIVVDLRQESHGFINGIAISWYAPRDQANVDKSLAAIEADETTRLAALAKGSKIEIHRILSKPQDVIEKSEAIPLVVERTATEKDLVQSLKLVDFRIPVTDHLPPSKEQLDRFVSFVRALPPNCWLHFHCEAGEGRTTSFLTLYDILRNGKKDSFETILKRQHQAGGIDLTQMPHPSSWKYPYAVERLQLLKNFYLTQKE